MGSLLARGNAAAAQGTPAGTAQPAATVAPAAVVAAADEQPGAIVLRADATVVDLTHTRQAAIPDCMRHMAQLQSLTLRWNLLSTIEGDKLRCDTLTYLDMYDNQITSMRGLESLVNLTHLDLSFNRLVKIEGLDELRQLRTLYLVHNGIRRIEGLDNNAELRLLELGDNKIKAIDNIGHLVKLHKLYLGANRIAHIEHVDTLASLHTLSLPANRIETIEGLGELGELRELYLTQNGIGRIGDALAAQTKLELLDLNDNRIEEVSSAELGHMTQLKDLWLQRNKLANLRVHLDTFARLPALRTLYMMSNPCTSSETDERVELEYRRRALIALPQITRLDFQPCREAPLTGTGAGAQTL